MKTRAGPHASPLLRGLAAAGPVLAVALLALAAWHLLAATVYASKAYLLPGPLDVAAAVVENAGDLVRATAVTLKEATLGYLLAIVSGIALAALLSQSRLLERSIYPYAVLLQTVPVVAIAPLIVLWFGYNELSVVIISFIMSLFPIVNNTLLGLRSTSTNLVELFTLHKASRAVAFWKLRLPGALPHIIAGLRISAGLSVIGAIVGEQFFRQGQKPGIGIVMEQFRQKLRYPAMFGGLIIAALLGITVFFVFSRLAKLVVGHWHESTRRGS